MKNNNQQHNKAFTVVETLVAVSILSISILASFTAVQGGLQSSTTARDNITAFYLAQEAMEHIKNVRDENALHFLSDGNTNWLSGLASGSDPCDFGNVCKLDAGAGSLTVCGNDFGSCPNIKQDSNTGLFGYGSGTDTYFKREIKFESNSANEVLVTIRVSWTSRGASHTFDLAQLLFNRQ